MTDHRTRIIVTLVLAGSGGSELLAQADLETVRERVGWYDLQERLGSGAMPDGTGIGVLQCEASGAGNSWIPDLDDASRYGGKDFTIPFGNPTTSSHANTVATGFYSNNGSIAPGVGNIWLYDANTFVTNGYLNLGQASSVPPIQSPDESIRVHNHSWIGQFNNGNDNLAMRRMDFMSIRDNILVVNGTNNGGSASHLFAHGFNTMTVGVEEGTHASADVPSGVDGPGRMKPWIVAPGDQTSWTTPIVGAVGAMLYEVIEGDPVLADEYASDRIQVMHAVLLAGASRDADWSNNPGDSGSDRGTTSRPLDEVFGAGLVNVDRSHRILTGYRSIGGTLLEDAPEVTGSGWDWPRVIWNSTKHWKFTVSSVMQEFSVALAWQRVPSSTFTGYSLMDIDLELFRLVDGELVSMVGPDGLGSYDSGNVRSASRVDNVELLRVVGLQPGEYVIRAQRQATGDFQNTYAGIAWLMSDEGPEPITGDINGDGRVDGLDLSVLLGAWGTDNPLADIIRDGQVDGADLSALLGNWG